MITLAKEKGIKKNKIMNTLKLPEHGFNEFSVPEMPKHTSSYSRRGNTYMGDQTPVYSQSRWGNKTGRGGMGGYLSQAEDPTFLEGYKVKLGDQGVFELTRWNTGYDWRGGFGIASLSDVKNFAGIQTRGGSLRSGGPKRSDVVERPNAWYEKTMPGISHGRLTQANDNYAGLYQWKKQTPVIQTQADPFILREMIERNPYHIVSHGAMGAKKEYDAEFQDAKMDRAVPGYHSNYDTQQINSMEPVVIRETQREMINRP